VSITSDQYESMGVECFAQGNNCDLWWGSNSRLTNSPDMLAAAPRRKYVFIDIVHIHSII